MEKMKRLLALVMVLCLLGSLCMTAFAYDGKSAEGVYQLELSMHSNSGRATPVVYASYLSADTALLPELYELFDEDTLAANFAGTGLKAIEEQGVNAYLSKNATQWSSYVNNTIGAQSTVDGAAALLSDTTAKVGQLAALGTVIEVNSKNYPGYTVLLMLRDQTNTKTKTLTNGTVQVTETLEDRTVVSEFATDGSVDVICTMADGKATTYHFTNRHEYALKYAAIRGDSVCACQRMGLTDVNVNGWYHEAVDFCLDRGLMNGTGSTTFSPNTACSRAMIVTILYRLENQPAVAATGTFTDVEDGKWYTKAIEWAAANGIVGGYGNGKFGPNDNITREQLAAILYRYAKYRGVDVTAVKGDISKYGDVGRVSSYAVEAMQWNNGVGLIQGNEKNELRPQDNALRSQIAMILMRFCKGFID